MIIITGLIASIGLTRIISISTVLLNIVYPTTMVLILLNLIKKYINNNYVFKLCTYITLLISLLDAIPLLQKYMNYIPLTKAGFGWVIPFVIVFLICNYFMPKENLVTNNKLSTDKLS